MHKHTLKMWVWVLSDAHPIKTRAVMGTGRSTGTNAVPTHCYSLEKLPRAVSPPPNTSAPPQCCKMAPARLWPSGGHRDFTNFLRLAGRWGQLVWERAENRGKQEPGARGRGRQQHGEEEEDGPRDAGEPVN